MLKKNSYLSKIGKRGGVTMSKRGAFYYKEIGQKGALSRLIRQMSKYPPETSIREFLFEESKKRKVKIQEYSKIWRAKSKDKIAAHKAVVIAVKNRILIKVPCEKCGIEKVEAHHYRGYAKRNHLSVQWLCRLHHNRLHSIIRSRDKNV